MIKLMRWRVDGKLLGCCDVGLAQRLSSLIPLASTKSLTSTSPTTASVQSLHPSLGFSAPLDEFQKLPAPQWKNSTSISASVDNDDDDDGEDVTRTFAASSVSKLIASTRNVTLALPSNSVLGLLATRSVML